MPIGHPLLDKIRQDKKNSDKNIEQLSKKDKSEMLKLEHDAVLANEKLKTLKQILTQPITYF